METQGGLMLARLRAQLLAHTHTQCMFFTLTILSTGSQQVNDVLVFANHLHHFHLRDEVSPVFLGGVRCKTRSHDFSFRRMFARKAEEDDSF